MDRKLPWYFIGVLFLLLTSLTALCSLFHEIIYRLPAPTLTWGHESGQSGLQICQWSIVLISYINLRLHVSGFAFYLRSLSQWSYYSMFFSDMY